MNTTLEEDARHSHPKVSHYDKRSANGQLEQERQREPELRAIRRRIRKLIEKLETAPDNNIQAKRLYFEILDRERDRLEGKPFTARSRPNRPRVRVMRNSRRPFRSRSVLSLSLRPAKL